MAMIRTVHPRRRGEHWRSPGPSAMVNGSSPQARGTPAAQTAELRRCRFIPAGAGNTSRQSANSRWRTVHPRRRGEHFGGAHPTAAKNGSSPQARGTHRSVTRYRYRCRFIPAGAGNTRSGKYWRWIHTVHPRRRGEHQIPGRRTRILRGSSPQARGTPLYGIPLPVSLRFIPAGAGNTSH